MNSIYDEKYNKYNKFSFKSTEISEKGALFLAESFSKIPGLSELALHLKGVELKDMGIQLLGKTLNKLSALKALTLDVA